MEFRFVETTDEARQVFPLMKELRDHLDEASFLQLLSAAKAESRYTLLAAFEDSGCVGLMGYRILTDFVHGRHLYIDDLVTKEGHRSRGLGARLLQEAKHIAAQNGCEKLRLCTGAQNERGKAFYERNGWALRAVVYKAQI